MSELMMQLTGIEVNEVNRLLERLFILNDKPAQPKKLEIFLDEIVNRGFNFDAIMAGLKEMIESDVKNIKVVDIINAIREKSRPREIHLDRCENCGVSGLISMRDEQGRSFTFACNCSIGQDKHRALKLQVWEGQDIQTWKNKLMTKR